MFLRRANRGLGALVILGDNRLPHFRGWMPNGMPVATSPSFTVRVMRRSYQVRGQPAILLGSRSNRRDVVSHRLRFYVGNCKRSAHAALVIEFRYRFVQSTVALFQVHCFGGHFHFLCIGSFANRAFCAALIPARISADFFRPLVDADIFAFVSSDIGEVHLTPWFHAFWPLVKLPLFR